MHELAVTQEIIELCCRRSEGARITRIVLEIGRLTCVSPEAVQFCFDVCSAGTKAEGARLEILRPPGRAVCHDCGIETESNDPCDACPCGGVLERRAGDELKIKEMEVL